MVELGWMERKLLSHYQFFRNRRSSPAGGLELSRSIATGRAGWFTRASRIGTSLRARVKAWACLHPPPAGLLARKRRGACWRGWGAGVGGVHMVKEGFAQSRPRDPA